MKKIMLSTLLFVMPLKAFAGIPTIDVGAIAQAVLVVKQAKEQWDTAKDQLKQEAELLKGGGDWANYDYDSLEELYNHTDIKSVDLNGIDGVSDLEEALGITLKGSDLELARKLEEQGKQIKRLENAIGRAESEAKKIDTLATKLANANTPAERESVLSSIQLASLSAESAQRALDNEMAKQQRINDIAEQAKFNTFMSDDMKAPSMSGRIKNQ